MENRVKRLMHEEERARSLQRKAEEKARQMMEARERHNKDLEANLAKYQAKLDE
jgi:ABC-type Zn uptake system ZnuABC Zn-binding protein ZnuA